VPVLTEPLFPPAARILIRMLVASGSATFSGHARRELSADGITEARVLAVLRGASSSRPSW
jgi:hypothetical protein